MVSSVTSGNCVIQDNRSVKISGYIDKKQYNEIIHDKIRVYLRNNELLIKWSLFHNKLIDISEYLTNTGFYFITVTFDTREIFINGNKIDNY